MKILITACALLFSSLVSAMPLNKIVVFGDSLSDNGNLYEYMKHQFPQDPPYFQGRFSNGPVWIELLTSTYFPEDSASHLQDYAFGGAGVLDEEDDDPDSALFTLRREVDSYLLAHHDRADENSLYVVWIGSNNYLAIPEDSEKALNTVLGGIQRDIKRLIEKGAKNILIVNLPDLGQTPAAYDFNETERLSYLSEEHNSRLRKNVSELEKEHPDVRWIYLDVGEIFHDAITSPEKYGFSASKIKGTCYDAEVTDEPSSQTMLKLASRVEALPGQGTDPCEGYLFFDPVHPTALAHQIMANISKTLLDEKGVEFG
ncbi:GDSL family lysophospholipase PlaA [Legionella oakridgensis]|uniref:Phospholipase/lecithinase/hemolysin n=2 Tax=Legionella oakridgensis TaxID=29423 RepID=W0BCN2_9GAMM|nr:SGNH/GDSL hydrolase family protein [Legionella oakridgensis]AHE66377.1 phospholipase/lecithinase/hemolysin [Legionella oakridgensis ATCC 33761 = DSM 21215]ETO93882.1 phospholipase/lecithinase/hemolysin [Legionella oakridgensis RV-2-2007]KTD44017.1 lysophospholipase A [Legionella oakridgensis]STY19560.1 lysophospholipase A [Legionella longbeachae]